MEINFEDRLIKKDIKKIKRKYTDNIFSTKLNSNIVKIIMKYLDIKYLYEYAKSCIFIFNNFIDYENEKLYNLLKKTENKNICKLFLPEGQECLGFLVKISNYLKALIVNTIMDDDLLGKIKKIKFIRNDKEQEINLNKRTITIYKEYNISFIEIFEEIDEIKDFYDCEDDISKLNYNPLICIFNNRDIVYGILKYKINKYDFKYLCQNDNIEKSTPILNLTNNKIIGIHINQDNNKLNQGYYISNFFFNFEFNALFNKNSNKFQRLNFLRLFRELKLNDNILNYKIVFKPDDFSNWEAIIFGPENTPYQNGKFHVKININKGYPFEPPKLYFLSKIFHPFFKGNNSKICSCIINEISNDNWSPAFSIPKLIDKIYSLLKNPEIETLPDCNNYNIECVKIMKENPEKYKEIAAKWTKDYASE